ncbi:MAG TPA: M56 family metallopeptidase [Nitrospirota bacterium]|nr:M56 family metallopeptidase [Nitrospirota bacterium]
MEKIHYVGLLFLNFTILNICLSVLFFIISYVTKKFVSSMYIKSRLFFTSILAPPVIALFTIVTSFIPPVFVKLHDGPMPCLNAPYCYIFSFIPDFPFFKVALIAAVILVLTSALYSIVSFRDYFRMRREINRLPELSIENNISNPPFPPFSKGGNISPPLKKGDIGGFFMSTPLKIIDTPLMFSFVWGYLSNIVVISAGALKALSPDELTCLLAHETSHYKRRDNILKGFLLICRNTLIVFPHVYYLFRWWREEIELIGDEAAVLRTGKPMDVASAILKMQMASGADISWNIDKYATGFNTPVNAKALTRRIERLVAIHDSKITPENVRFSLIPSEISMITGLAFLFPMLFGMIYEIDPLMLHCYFEKLASVL